MVDFALEEFYSHLVLSPDLVPLDPGDYVDISDGAGAVVASPQVSDVEPEDAGVGPHGGDVRADPEPQSSVGESEVEIGVKRGHQKEADAHQELYAPEGDGHVIGGVVKGAHQELYAPESEVTTEGEEIVGEVPHVMGDGGEAELPAEELYAPVGEDRSAGGVIVGDVPNVDGAEAEVPAEELHAPVGESIPDVGIEEGVDEGLETELEGVGLAGDLPGHVMVLHKLVSVRLWNSHVLPLIESLKRAQTGVILDQMSRAEFINLVEGGHTTKNREKDHVWTDLDVNETDDGGEILGRSVDPLSSASETLETVDSRPETNSDLGWNLNSDTILVLERN